jgi:uncharacterized membrane protein
VEWALLLLALATAVFLRFYRLEQIPPGLYRDEAFNGLDALKVLRGDLALYFGANNGREPLYIYLTAAAVALFGQTAFAVRLGAAVVGSLTTLPIYLLGRSWFGWRVGLLAAWIWAITLWPVHLSRVGLRVILLVPVLVITFWLGTAAYRRRENWLWFLTGIVYGLGFYTYLAARFTPLPLILIGLYLLFTGRLRRLWPGVAWTTLGIIFILLPLLIVIWQQPDLILGRSGQVSVLHPDVNGGDLWGTLWQNTLAAIGLFLWSGDMILRHNPVGRPVFDWLIAIPFLIGLVWCVRQWRRPAAMIVLIWTGSMLGPTILAADAPHFLRAAGILPLLVYLPAIGLERIWLWSRVPGIVRSLLVGGLILGSLLLTIRDYVAYGRDPEVGYAFESAAAELARQLNEELTNTTLFLDEQFWSSWPSVSFLVADPKNVSRFLSPDSLPDKIVAPAAIYTWPYDPLDYIPGLMEPPAVISVTPGELARSDLNESPYSLYVRYGSEELPAVTNEPLAAFADLLLLQQTGVAELSDDWLQVDVYWQAETALDEELVVFVHVVGPEGLVGQDDNPPAEGRWPKDWWRAGQIIRDRHTISLDEPYDPTKHQILVGLYERSTGIRLPVSDVTTGEPLGSSWTIRKE